MIEIKTDLLVVGGGVAGLHAGIAAREKGAEVLATDKAAVARSGCIGAGVDHFAAFLEQGESWDTAEAWLKYVAKTGRGALDLKIHETIFCKELKSALARMSKMGNDLRDPATGKYNRSLAFGQPGPYLINFKGKDFRPNQAKEFHRLGGHELAKAMATRLITSNGRLAGALAFNIRSGELYLIRAKAVVLATGNASRLFENPSGNPFNCWHSPFNTGDGTALAYRAGAALANVEYMYMTVVPKGFSAPGYAAFASMGCQLINAAGKRFMLNYSPAGERVPRIRVVQAVLTEMAEGRGPVYIDCRHLSEPDLNHLKATLGWDKDTFPDYLAQKGLDIANEPMEIMVSEGNQATEAVNGGVKIDQNCAASLEGLFAAGDCCDQASAVNKSTTSGFVAGRAAAAWALKLKEFEPLDNEQVNAEKERLFKPIKRRTGTSGREFEDIICRVMSELAGIKRNESGLKIAQGKLAQLNELQDELVARDYHQLMRIEEARNLLTVGQVMASAALYRKESRFGLCHNRIDYPNTDDENWCGLVVVKKVDDKPQTSFQPLEYQV